MKTKVLLIDNFDSFTYNLAHYLDVAGSHVTVIRNNNNSLFDAIENFNNVVVSPGPSTPNNAGLSIEIVKRFYKEKSILGICLGMQVINEVFEGKTIKAPYPVHGKISPVSINTTSTLFTDLPEIIKVARYHSLICSEVSPSLKITSQLDSIPMAFEHIKYPLFGVQFHPESFLTEYGLKIISNFLRK